MKETVDMLKAEAAAEMVVLAALKTTSMHPIEIQPSHGQSPQEIKEAVERCEAAGWIKTGRASHYDPRAHLEQLSNVVDDAT